jgi:sulfonate transport system permease protein
MWARALNWPGLLTIAIVVAAWEIAVRGGAVTFDFLPSPSAIAVAMAGLAASGQLLTDTAHTLRSVLIGWVIAGVLGIGLGLLLGLSGSARRYGMATVEVLRPMPGIAFLPLALLIFNFSLETELALIIYPALWPIMINTMGGITDVAARLYDVGRTFRLTRAQTLSKLLIPAAAASILVGARLSLGVALVMAIIAEMLGNPQGARIRHHPRDAGVPAREDVRQRARRRRARDRAQRRHSGGEPVGVPGSFRPEARRWLTVAG